jgi:hypothetical protein
MTTELTWMREGGTVALQETNRTVTFETIERLTATQIILTNGRKFRRRPGFWELKSDSGHGYPTNRGGRLVDPANAAVVTAYAQQQLLAFADEASTTTYGAGATVHKMNASAVRAELDRLADLLNKTRQEIGRRAGL